ncbi:hypothetical protein H072_5792 [Dactylellina haptotyla CBS 200.50]|uniref:Uncharacterized protein n=1 Tax=Dactylellina haptotyla (strain CBS 200.50) TaxID=1284197 RepID=S8ABV4_DACHA|nr:hypothetical protein H072_5792 [Dactylellina haptotyla CBS 200.50]
MKILTLLLLVPATLSYPIIRRHTALDALAATDTLYTPDISLKPPVRAVAGVEGTSAVEEGGGFAPKAGEIVGAPYIQYPPHKTANPVIAVTEPVGATANPIIVATDPIEESTKPGAVYARPPISI